MNIECSFVEFHTPVFFRGKNYGLKVHANAKTGIKLYYSVSLRLMFMEVAGKVCFFDTYHSAEPVNFVPDMEEPKAKPGPKPKA